MHTRCTDLQREFIALEDVLCCMATITDETAHGTRIVEAVSEWPGVSAGPHRFGATAFTLDGREVGHLHNGRTLDINFPKRMRDQLLASEATGKHHFAGGGWTSYYVDSSDDIEHALWLLRLSYCYTLLTMRRKPTGKAILSAVDFDIELDQLDLEPELRAMFDRMRP